MRVAPADAERARATLLELAPHGFEEATLDDALEFALYTDRPADEARLRRAFGSVHATPLAPGWEEAWKRFHKPVVVAGLWIGPPWEEPPSTPALVIDPGLAFGTGAHATTRLCVELLAAAERGRLLDVGCGSGVLAIAAALLGYRDVVAVDVDPDAVVAARGNARANGVAIDVRRADALAAPLPPVDVTVANIALEPVERLAPRLETRVLISSGYFASDEPRLVGYDRTERRTLEGWAADLHVRQ